MAESQLTFTQNGIINKNASEQIKNISTIIDDLNSDKKITPYEKQVLNDEYNKIAASHEIMLSQITAYEITDSTAAANLSSAYNMLYNSLYTDTGAPLIDMTTTSDTDISTIKNIFVTYYNAEEKVNHAISDKISGNANTAIEKVEVIENTVDGYTTDINTAKQNAQTAIDTANGFSDDINQAKSDAAAALSAVERKTKVFTQDTAPVNSTALPLVEGDIWYKTGTTTSANGTTSTGIIAVYVYTGSAWQQRKVDYAALSVGKLSALTSDLGTVTAGTITGTTITGTTINGSNINGSKIISTESKTSGYVNQTIIDGGNINFNIIDKSTGSAIDMGGTINGDGIQFLEENYDYDGSFSSHVLYDGVYVRAITNGGGEVQLGYKQNLGTRLWYNGLELSEEKNDTAIVSTDRRFEFSGATNWSFDAPLNGHSFNNSEKGGTVFINLNSVNVGGDYSNAQTGMDHVSIGTATVYTPRIFTDTFYLEGKRIEFATGKVAAANSGNTPTATSVSFGKTFSSTPLVFLTPNTSVPGTSQLGEGVTDVTTRGFTVYSTRINTSNTSISWLAINIS